MASKIIVPVTKEDRKALSDAVNSLGEPLSKMAVVTE